MRERFFNIWKAWKMFALIFSIEAAAFEREMSCELFRLLMKFKRDIGELCRLYRYSFMWRQCWKYHWRGEEGGMKLIRNKNGYIYLMKMEITWRWYRRDEAACKTACRYFLLNLWKAYFASNSYLWLTHFVRYHCRWYSAVVNSLDLERKKQNTLVIDQVGKGVPKPSHVSG